MNEITYNMLPAIATKKTEHQSDNTTMNTHATNLLRALIEGLINAMPNPELHAHQMLAAELKGAMAYEWTEQPPVDAKPTPDADGWVENMGKEPTCDIAKIKQMDGTISNAYFANHIYRWQLTGRMTDITHYKPA